MSIQDPYQQQPYGGYPPPPQNPPQYTGVPYGTPPAAATQDAYTAYGYAPTPPAYAHWGLRVGAMLLDLLAWAPYWIGAVASSPLTTPGYDELGQPTTTATPASSTVLALGVLVSFALWVWNRGFQQARTGQSWGKKALGLRLVLETTGENVGVWRALLRDLAHWFDCWLLGLGFWFPLWDAKRQTFADKIAKTVAVR